ncbi:MAG: hypothetical protein HYV18_03365 [Gammaproteobacteria bacterium]|nr:hypothetical protein [Gammaproteobacteria bacterium]
MQNHSIRALGLSLALVAPLAAQAQAQAAKGEPTFNPRISLILNGTYADYGRAGEAEVPGFILGPETELRPEGLSLGESELAIESNVDQSFHGWATIALENEDGETVVAVEEAYLNTLALPAGLALKFGRFFSDIGYQNRQHNHAWEFADAALPYRVLLANHLADDGVQLRWVAPADLLVEVGAEVLRGSAFPGGGEDRGGSKGQTVFVHVGGDAGSGGAWRLGAWHYNADAKGRETGEDAIVAFTGDSKVSGVDAVFKWAPEGNPAQTNLVLQAEYMLREEDGDVTDETAAATSGYDGRQTGFYVQGIYQFMPRWRVGLRYDRLHADNDVTAPAAGTALADLAEDGTDPERWSAMADFSNSEFSRLRLQVNRDESRADGKPDDQVLVQYIFSLGSHPAHQF